MQQFDALFTKYKRRFTLFADSYIHDMQLAEDIVTDAFMAYWEAFRQSPPAGINAPAYILTIVKNKCINELEHRKVHEKFVASSLTDAQWELRMRWHRCAPANPTRFSRLKWKNWYGVRCVNFRPKHRKSLR